jgi:hypothetical protein
MLFEPGRTRLNITVTDKGRPFTFKNGREKQRRQSIKNGLFRLGLVYNDHP